MSPLVRKVHTIQTEPHFFCHVPRHSDMGGKVGQKLQGEAESRTATHMSNLETGELEADLSTADP